MQSVLLVFISILCFIFSGIGILVIMGEFLISGFVFDHPNAIPSPIRMLIYLGFAGLGTLLWSFNNNHKEE